MDQRIRYKVTSKALAKRAAMLSRLDDAAEQRREIGLVASGIEEAVNQGNWALVEKLTTVLVRLRESQQKARERARELVDILEFRVGVLTPVLNCIAARLQEALPNDYETVVDRLYDDLHGIHPRLLEDKRHA